MKFEKSSLQIYILQAHTLAPSTLLQVDLRLSINARSIYPSVRDEHRRPVNAQPRALGCHTCVFAGQ